MIKKFKIKRTCGHFTKVMVHERHANDLVKRYRSTMCDDYEKRKYTYPQSEPVFAVIGPVVPPDHHNCRCEMDEPFEDDEFDADALDISDLLDEDGFTEL